MTLSLVQPKSKPSNVIPFAPLSQSRLRRQITALINAFAVGYIGRAAMNDYLAGILSPRRWVDCGSYQVELSYTTGDERLPVITFTATEISRSGQCPVCGKIEVRYLGGEDERVQVWCMNCSCVYEVSGEVLS